MLEMPTKLPGDDFKIQFENIIDLNKGKGDYEKRQKMLFTENELQS